MTPDGNTLVLADASNHRIRVIDVSGSVGVVSTLAGSGAAGYADGVGAAAVFRIPMGVALSLDGLTAYVVDYLNYRVGSLVLKILCFLCAVVDHPWAPCIWSRMLKSMEYVSMGDTRVVCF